MHTFDRCPMADVFIFVDDDIALTVFDGVGDNLIVKLARLLRGFCLVLRCQREFVLLIAADLPFFSDVFGGLAHVIAVERIPQTVTDHRVDVFDITHFVTGAQMRDMGRQCHVFLAASRHNRCIAQLDMLRSQCNSTQAGTTHLVNAPSSGFDWQSGVDVRLTCRVLTLAGGQHLTKDCFAYVSFLDARTGDQRLKHGSAKIMCRNISE